VKKEIGRELQKKDRRKEIPKVIEKKKSEKDK